MELKNLYGVILTILMVGMIIGIGVLIFDKFGIAVKTRTTVVNETVAFTTGSGTTANDDVYSITQLTNSTNTYADTGDNINFTTAGVITTWANVTGNYKVTYLYDADSKSTDVMDDMTTATSAIPSTWLPLLVTIIILAIILGIVITSFTLGGNRK